MIFRGKIKTTILMILKIFYNCIKTTNFEILKHKEKKEGFPENVYSKKTNKKIDFFNLGPKNKWEKVIPKEFHEKINNIFKQDLKNLKY